MATKKYGDYVSPYVQNFIIIDITSDTANKIRRFVNEVIRIKALELHHKSDCHNEFKRFYTGTLGEAALEQHLGVEIIDWSVGCSNTYNVADLSNCSLNIGIKTVEYGKYPIIHKNPRRPEIINIKANDKQVLICGLATKECLRKFQDDNLVLSPNLKRRGTKTGFYGFHELLRFMNLEELKHLHDNELIS